MNYLTPTQVYKKYGYHPKTLSDWADQGKIACIKSPGGHRRYPESAFIGDLQTDKERVIYAHVSTRTQLEELDTQIEFLSKTYPNSRIVKDVVSGMNWKRKKFLKLMTQVANNKISEIMSIMHCSSSKLYFLRAYKKKIEEEQNIPEIIEPSSQQCESMSV